ncbi:MAG: 1-acyl-sn-glycerol-3-phosphate acyltransferase [Firmicutes bacterium]|nr:1-acyl-sn-glycerol-3-phosphate acyltransferase [Bacillota bacterium]
MLYRLARFFFRVLFRLLWRWRVEGLENFPREGPVVLVANHVSLWDPIAAACAVPRMVHFMAKEELFQYPVLGKALVRIGVFPVKRGKPDRNAIRRSLELLEEKKVLGIFPEGTRSKTGELQKPHPGAAMIALKAGSPVVPVACLGTVGLWKKIFKKDALVIRIGAPAYYEEYCEQRLSAKCLENISEDIMKRVAMIMEENGVNQND